MGLSSPDCLRGTAGTRRFPCPCCGHLTFGEPPGSHEICPVCFWEDDALQLEFATTLADGANRSTLLAAQRSFVEIGACDAESVRHVRPPADDEPRDPLWRAIDERRDFFPMSGAHGEALYYWRTNHSSTRTAT